MRTKALTSTKKCELVETHNLALAITRLQDAPYDSERWKRALHHAISMTCSRVDTEKIRVALNLP